MLAALLVGVFRPEEIPRDREVIETFKKLAGADLCRRAEGRSAMAKKHLIVRFWVTVVAVLAVLADGALAQVPFYQGKTLVVVVGTAPGGAGDHRTKALVPSLRNTSPEIRQSCSSTRLAVAVGKQPTIFTRWRSRTD
jgi:hypothetical protein